MLHYAFCLKNKQRNKLHYKRKKKHKNINPIYFLISFPLAEKPEYRTDSMKLTITLFLLFINLVCSQTSDIDDLFTDLSKNNNNNNNFDSFEPLVSLSDVLKEPPQIDNFINADPFSDTTSTPDLNQIEDEYPFSGDEFDDYPFLVQQTEPEPASNDIFYENSAPITTPQQNTNDYYESSPETNDYYTNQELDVLGGVLDPLESFSVDFSQTPSAMPIQTDLYANNFVTENAMAPIENSLNEMDPLLRFFEETEQNMDNFNEAPITQSLKYFSLSNLPIEYILQTTTPGQYSPIIQALANTSHSTSTTATPTTTANLLNSTLVSSIARNTTNITDFFSFLNDSIQLNASKIVRARRPVNMYTTATLARFIEKNFTNETHLASTHTPHSHANKVKSVNPTDLFSGAKMSVDSKSLPNTQTFDDMYEIDILPNLHHSLAKANNVHFVEKRIHTAEDSDGTASTKGR